MAAYLGYTLRMKTLFHGWPIMVNDTHTRKKKNKLSNVRCPFVIKSSLKKLGRGQHLGRVPSAPPWNRLTAPLKYFQLTEKDMGLDIRYEKDSRPMSEVAADWHELMVP